MLLPDERFQRGDAIGERLEDKQGAARFLELPALGRPKIPRQLARKHIKAACLPRGERGITDPGSFLLTVAVHEQPDDFTHKVQILKFK